MAEKVKGSSEQNPQSPSWESLFLNEDRTRKSEYLESKKGQEELSIEDTFDSWVQELDDMVEEGKITREEARAQQEDMLQSAVEGIIDVRNQEYERQRKEKLQELANVFHQMAAARGNETTAKEPTITAEAGEQSKEEPKSEKAKLMEELKQLDEELGLDGSEEDSGKDSGDNEEGENLDDEKAKLEAELAELDKELELVAINADMTHDKDELASDLAEISLNEETAHAKIFKRLWKGTLFKKYYHKKYTREYLEGKRTQNVDGEDLTVYDLIDRRKEGAIKRFVLGVIDGEEGFVHKKAGENLVEADAEMTAALKAAIEKFASAPEDADEEELKREFENDVARLKAEARDNGRASRSKNFTVDNYLEIAIQARECALHHIGMDRIMEGIKLYNAEVRDGIRTEAHRDNIDKIVNKLESSKIGQFIPAEVLAGAVSVVSALTGTGARAAFGAAGGIVASSVIAGLKERNRITEDRARLLRDVANGMNYENISISRTDKYEAKLFGTCYDLQRASDLTKKLEDAIAFEGEGRTEVLLSAIAEARVRIDFSDENQKDLIAFSSEDKRGTERLNLDKALIYAERSLPEEDRTKLEELKTQISKQISESVDEKDQDFRKKRAVMALKKSGVTLGIGLGTFFITQEMVAIADPGKIGLLEKAGIIKRANNENASETLLASGFGFNRGVIRQAEVVDTVRLRGDQEVEMEMLGKDYTRTTVSEAWTEYSKTPDSIREISPETLADRLRVKYDGWANNGTSVADGNELRAYLTDGQMVSGMRGISTMGNQSFNYEELAAAGRIKGYLTIGGTKFELASKLNEAGQLTWGENGVFTTTAGETIKALGDNGEKLYKYFEIALDNGVDADGVQHIIPFATDAGRDTFSGTIQAIQKTVSVPIEHPAVYEFTKTITNETPRAVTGFGLAFAPETPRTGLAGPRRVESLDFQNEILDQSEGLNDAFKGFITEPNIQSSSAYSPERTAEYGAWWESQGDDEKARAVAILKRMRESEDWKRSNWGSSFMTWMQLNHADALAS